MSSYRVRCWLGLLLLRQSCQIVKLPAVSIESGKVMLGCKCQTKDTLHVTLSDVDCINKILLKLAPADMLPS